MFPSDTLTNALFLVLGLLSAVGFIHGTTKEPRRISNGVLLILALYFITTGGLYLLAPDLTTADGQFAFGQGSEMLFALEALFMLISFFGGIALIINGVHVCYKEGVSMAHLLPLAFGVAAVAWPFIYMAAFLLMMVNVNLAITLLLAHQIISVVLMYVPAMLAAVLLYAFVYAALPKTKHPNYIIVHGAGLRGDKVTPLLAGRCNRAIKLFNAGGGEAVIITSGGQGADELVPEALAMKNYLVENGVPKNKIIMEGKSTTTAENLEFSKRIIEKHTKHYSAIVVTSNYHVLRTVILARSVGLNAQGVGSHTKLYYLPAAFIREYIAVIFSYKNLALTYVAIAIIWVVLVRVF
ncbi:MAG: YdcF family protein [Candidatus Nomurabacteria bacterium]|jgi:uncharacterized SAM-binding protein YcdF (DUF218 family)|nr:YdcF family protein [Candidatus Nomurabacteria bacterium]